MFRFKGKNFISLPGDEVYSTEETCIGTWIDGKPLYRRVFEATIPDIAKDYSWQTLNAITDENITCVMINSWVIDADNAIEPLPTTAGSGTNLQPTKVYFNPGVGIAMYNQGSWYVGRTCRTVISYIKSSD